MIAFSCLLLVCGRFLKVDAYDGYSQRGNDTREGRHLEASYKYIKNVLIPQSRRLHRDGSSPHALVLLPQRSCRHLDVTWEESSSASSEASSGTSSAPTSSTDDEAYTKKSSDDLAEV